MSGLRAAALSKVPRLLLGAAVELPSTLETMVLLSQCSEDKWIKLLNVLREMTFLQLNGAIFLIFPLKSLAGHDYMRRVEDALKRL